MPSELAIFIGTEIQEKICRRILPGLYGSESIGKISVVSLDRFYRFGLNHRGYNTVNVLKDCFPAPWYDREKAVKLISLPLYIWQLFWLSRKIRHFLFFVDTGVLERAAIIFLRAMGCNTAVLQDAMKRKPRFGSKHSLAWFGGGGADLYLLIGKRYESMIQRNRPSKVVGSPVYDNRVNPVPPGKNILIVNQCFAKYGEISLQEEYTFIHKVVAEAIKYGPVELRLHPHNNFEHYQKLNRYPINITQKQPLQQSIIDAGIVLCINSTVILEALAMGRKVVALDWHPSPYEQPANDLVIHCANRKEMGMALAAWRNSQKVEAVATQNLQKTMNSFVALRGSSSTRRIVSELEAFVGNR